MKTILKTLGMLVVICFAVSNSALAKLNDLQLIIGDSQTLKTEYEIGDIAITDGSVVQYIVRDNRKEIYVNPLKEGQTTLTVWDKADQLQDKITISIVPVNIEGILKEAQAYIQDILGVQAVVEGGQVKLTGEVNSPTQLKDIQTFCAKNPKVINQVVLSNKAMDVIAERIEEAIATPGVTVRAVRGQLVMEGLTYSADIYKKIDQIARLYDKNIINLVEVRSSNRRPGSDITVKLDVYFMEIKNSAIRKFGIEWAPGSTLQNASAQGAQSGGGLFGLGEGINTVVGFVFNLLPKIRWIHETGRGRVLERPSFIVKSGENVDFFSGSEIPYYGGESVEFKEVGVRVHAEPIAYQNDVDLKIKVDVSSLSSTSDQGIDRSNLDTTVYVKADQAVVLGGLIRNGDVKTYNKVPKGIDTTSALFSLFLSRDFQTNESQFYIFIVPSVTDSPQPAEMKLKRWLELHKELDHSRKFIK